MNIVDKLLNKREKYHAGEIFALWQHLVQRYDIREMTDIFQNYAKDMEFKALLVSGTKILDDEIKVLEDELDNLRVPLPPRPPRSVNTPGNTEILRDQLMFRLIYMGIQNFLTQQTETFLTMQNPGLKDLFQDMTIREMDLVRKMNRYGELKGWLFIPPAYNPQG